MVKRNLVVISSKIARDLKKRIKRQAHKSGMTMSEYVAGTLFQKIMERVFENDIKEHRKRRG